MHVNAGKMGRRQVNPNLMKGTEVPRRGVPQWGYDAKTKAPAATQAHARIYHARGSWRI